MKQRTPQEKKVLSYEKDCRNSYGEHDKGARKTIRKNKTVRNQIYRRQINQTLQEAIGFVDMEKAEVVQDKTKSVHRSKWKKCADQPLGQFVERQLEMRKRRVGRKLRGTLKDIKDL